jgi:hypothetical protein
MVALHAPKDAAGRWLICLELQALHLAGHRSAIEGARDLLAHARRNHWPVVHIHFRPLMGRADCRPAPGCEPHPSEPVFFRDGLPATPDHPFWRLARQAEGAEALLCGVVADPAAVRGIEATHRIGVNLTLVRGALGGTVPQALADRLDDIPLRRVLAAPTSWLLEAANAP